MVVCVDPVDGPSANTPGNSRCQWKKRYSVARLATRARCASVSADAPSCCSRAKVAWVGGSGASGVSGQKKAAVQVSAISRSAWVSASVRYAA